MRVFISYHVPDRALALALRSALIAARPDLDVFVDQTHLRHGHLWQSALFDAIARADAFIILVSNRLGDWQKVEYYEARDRKARDDTFILLPIIIADRARGPAANLPGLAQLQWIESTEPSAPDPLAKLLAALSLTHIPKPQEPWRAINPYRGLVALEEQDADFFFGRDRETTEIVNQILTRPGRLLTLVGNSGVGKSSLVQAGVIGSLKRQRWPSDSLAWPQALHDSRSWSYLTMRPGESPIEALAAEFASLWINDPTDPDRLARRNAWVQRLRDGTTRVADLIEATERQFRDVLAIDPPPRFVLYIDQGEELYARTPRLERKLFSDLIAKGLTDCAPRLIVMTSWRSDYYGELQANAALFNLSDKVDVAPLGAEKLAQVLGEPARTLQVGFESSELVAMVIKSAEDQPGALPLLADLFTDLWDKMQDRGDGILRISDRREIIQVGAALSQRADRFVALNPQRVEDVRRLFTLRLAHVPRHGEPVRRRMLRSADRPQEWELVEQLAGSDWRLVVTGEQDGHATAEVAHEVLLKTWGQLRSWLETEREFLVWRDELDVRRVEWEEAPPNRKRDALLTGLGLEVAQHWLATRSAEIEADDKHFIAASTRAQRSARIGQINGLVAVLLTSLFVPLAGFLIFTQYRQEIETSFDERLKTLLLVVYTDSSDHTQGEPGAPRDVGEPLFEVTGSGWYWQIKPTESNSGRRTIISKSLGSAALSSPYEMQLPPDAFGLRWATVEAPGGNKSRVVEMIQALGGDDDGPRYSYLVAGPAEWPQAKIAAFRTRLIAVLSWVMAGLLAVGLSSLYLGQLRPKILPFRKRKTEQRS